VGRAGKFFQVSKEGSTHGHIKGAQDGKGIDFLLKAEKHVQQSKRVANVITRSSNKRRQEAKTTLEATV
jgi:hypothetical protein